MPVFVFSGDLTSVYFSFAFKGLLPAIIIPSNYDATTNMERKSRISGGGAEGNCVELYIIPKENNAWVRVL